MNKARWLLGTAAVLAMAAHSHAQIVLIDPTTNNGSFEFAGGVENTDKIDQWDGTPDVDSWSEWVGESTDSADSGVEMTGSATDGVMSAFLRGGNAAYNLTSYSAVAGDLFTFSWDHALRPDRDHSVWLVYEDAGTITQIEASRVDTSGANPEPYTYEGFYTIPAGSPAIGKQVGLGIHAFGAYPEVDNFYLEVETGGMPPVTGDVDGDFDVDLIDYGIIRDNFRLSPADKDQGDITGTDIVDLEDFLLWRANYPYPPAVEPISVNVPEPAAALLAVIGLTALRCRRIRR